MDNVSPTNNFAGLSPFSTVYRERLEALAHDVYEWNQAQPSLIKMLAQIAAMPPMAFGFWGLAGTSVLTTANIWKYAWQQGMTDTTGKKLIIDPNGRSSKVNGTEYTEPAYNFWEQNNTATITTLGMKLTDPSVTITLNPIPAGAPIYLYLMAKPPTMTPAWFFAAPNEPDVACPSS